MSVSHDYSAEAVCEKDLATLILTLLSVADDDRTLSRSLSALASETPEADFDNGMREAARRIGVLLGTAQQLELARHLSANRIPV